MHPNQLLGARGEASAVNHLIASGHRVLARNWRPSGRGIRGELDVVALDGPVLVVVEVKTRSSAAAGTASQAVGWRKRRRLRQLTTLWLAEHPHVGPVRGDVIALDHDPQRGAWTLTHHRGAW